MYLRTPKRYTRYGRRRHNLISLRWLWLWILTPVVAFAGMHIYRNQEAIRPRIDRFFEGLYQDASSEISTRRAPLPTATPDPTAAIQRANEAWSRGAIQQAVEFYREAVQFAPNDFATHYFYTLGLIMQGNYRQALEAAELAITANPFAADVWTVRATALNRSGSVNAAIASALQALELVPAQAVEENPALGTARTRALAALAESYYYNEQYERAQTLVDEALTYNPDSPEAYYVQGLINQGRDFDLLAAREQFAAAYELAPNLIYLGNQLALTDYALGNYDSMLAVFNDILDLNPNNTPALYWLGDYYFRIVGDPNQSSDYLSRCVRANPENAGCQYLLGRSQMRLELYLDALVSFEAALSLNDENGYYYYWTAEAHINLLNCGQAMSYLQPGYRIAIETDDQPLIDAFRDSLQRCGSPVAAPTIPVIEVTSPPSP